MLILAISLKCFLLPLHAFCAINKSDFNLTQQCMAQSAEGQLRHTLFIHRIGIESQVDTYNWKKKLRIARVQLQQTVRMQR